MSKVDELERQIEQLPPEDFEKLSVWIEQKRLARQGKTDYPKHQPNLMALRDHSAFLSSYAPEDEGLYEINRS